MKGFVQSRQEIKDALEKQKAALSDHRERLASFEKAYAMLDTNTDEAVGDILHESILREQKRVKSIETNIRDLERDLKTRYSVTPKYLAM